MADNLSSLINRLEAVTTRLEAAEGRITTTASGAAPGSIPPPSRTASQTTTAAAAPGAAPAAAQAVSSAGTGGDEALAAYDSLLSKEVAAFARAAGEVGGDVLAASQTAEEAFKKQRGVVAAILACKKPDTSELTQLVAPVGELMMAASARADGPRGPYFNHVKCLAESLQGMSWVVYSPGSGMSPPGKHVEESWQSAEFYVNKILMQYRGSEPAHVQWVTTFKEAMKAFQEFTGKYFPSGPTWNPAGQSVPQFMKAGGGAAAGLTPAAAAPAAAPAAAAPPKPRGGAPPPPPPGPPPAPDLNKERGAGGAKKPAGAAGGMGAVFAEISKGDGVTSGLRKVTDDMKTKNRADRSGAVPSAPPKPSGSGGASAAAAKPAAAKPPRFELENGRKWVVENQEGNRELVVEGTLVQSVYMYNCSNSVLQVKGKLNTLQLDKCTKVGVVFTSLVSTCEVVNSRSCEVQVQGSVPAIIIDKVDGCQIYLGQDALGVDITTAKSSGINVVTPGANPDDDFVEHYIPEQFVSRIRDGKVVTEAVVHSGA